MPGSYSFTNTETTEIASLMLILGLNTALHDVSDISESSVRKGFGCVSRELEKLKNRLFHKL